MARIYFTNEQVNFIKTLFYQCKTQRFVYEAFCTRYFKLSNPTFRKLVRFYGILPMNDSDYPEYKKFVLSELKQIYRTTQKGTAIDYLAYADKKYPNHGITLKEAEYIFSI